jgi:hypothetical protein
VIEAQIPLFDELYKDDYSMNLDIIKNMNTNFNLSRALEHDLSFDQGE